MKLRLGLLGLSNDWNTRYLPALRTLQDRFEVVGVYCSVATFAETVAREFGTRRCDGYRELLRRDDVDAVLMLEGQWYGILPILAACDYGKAVYCGSDIDFDPQQAALVRQEVDRAGIAFMAEFPRRFAPASIRLKELMATRLGPPQLLFCHKRLTCESPGSRGRSLRTKADRELVELLDWCSFIVGRKIRSVQCIEHHPPDGSNGAADGPEAVVDYRSMTSTCPHPMPRWLTIAQISCGAYIPTAWHEAIAYRPPPPCRCVARTVWPSSIYPTDWSGSTRRDVTKNRESERAVGNCYESVSEPSPVCSE